MSYIILVVALLVALSAYVAQEVLAPTESYRAYSESLRAEVQAVFQANEDVYSRALDQQGLLSYAGLDRTQVVALSQSTLGRNQLRAEALVGATSPLSPYFGSATLENGQVVSVLVLGPLKRNVCQAAPLASGYASDTALLQAISVGPATVVPNSALVGCLTVASSIYATWVLGG